MCNGDTCSQRGADDVTLALRRALAEEGLDGAVHTARTRCLGRCDDGCTVVVQPDNIWYREVSAEVARRIVQAHLGRGEPVTAHVSFEPGLDGLRQISGTRPGVPKPGSRAASDAAS